MAKSLLKSPVTKQLSLRVPPAKLAELNTHLRAVNQYLATPKIAKVIDLWPTLPQEVKDEIVEKAPVFGRLVALAERFES